MSLVKCHVSLSLAVREERDCVFDVFTSFITDRELSASFNKAYSPFTVQTAVTAVLLN